MKIIELDDYKALSELAGDMIEKRIINNLELRIGLATGSTPLGMYERVMKSYVEKKVSTFENVVSFNLDEYIGLSKSHPQSYHTFMRHHLFDFLDFQKKNIHIPDGEAVDLENECEGYENIINRHGGIDFQILGLGSNGHIGFNEPGTPFTSRTHIVELDESTRKANSRFFNHTNEVPTSAITMGLGSIMESKEILLLISGSNKEKAYKQLLKKNITTEFPASILHEHPNVTVLVDKTCLSFC